MKTLHIARSLVLTCVVSVAACVAVAAQTFPFPGRFEDLQTGEFWYWSRASHGGGDQTLGYDLVGIRYDTAAGEWTYKRVGASNQNYNSDHVIYNKPVYAITDGDVVCSWRNAPENYRPNVQHEGRLTTPTTIPNGGNFVMVKQDDGTFVLYAHMRPNTIPTKFCKSNAQFVADGGKSVLDPTHEGFFPMGQRPRVHRGEMIGRVGNAGASSGPHLHVHMLTPNKQAAPLPFKNIRVKSPNGNTGNSANWRRIGNEGEQLVGPLVILPDYASGHTEITRAAIPMSDYNLVINHVMGSGYYPETIDGYVYNNANYFNVVFRPNDGKLAATFHGQNATEHNATRAQYLNAGYRETVLEAYPTASGIRYATVFRKDNGPATYPIQAPSLSEYAGLAYNLALQGWRTKNLAPVRYNNVTTYTGLLELSSADTRTHSSVSLSEFVQLSQQYDTEKRRLVHVNAFYENGYQRFAAIWGPPNQGGSRVRWDMSVATYQNEFASALAEGLRTHALTAFQDGSVRFISSWK